MMTLDEYLSLVTQYTSLYDKPSVVRSYSKLRKGSFAGDKDQICHEIQKLLPTADAVSVQSILENYGAVSEGSIGRATKWLEQNREDWQETLCGIYVSSHTAQKFRYFLDHALPIQGEFEVACASFGVEPTQMLYADFCRNFGNQLLKTKCHPFCIDWWFWMDTPEALHKLFRNWYMAYTVNIPSVLEGYVSVLDAATCLEIKPNKLMAWLWEHENYYTYANGRCLINMSTVDSLKTQWDNAYTISTLVQQKIARLPARVRPWVKAQIESWLQSGTHDWVLPVGTLPQQREGVLYTEQPLVANHALDCLINTFPVFLVNRLREITGLSTKKLKMKAQNGAIAATEDESGNWYISINEYRRTVAIQEQYISLDQIILSCLSEIDSKFTLSDYRNRERLINYCNNYDWWGLEYVSCEKLPMDGRIFGIAVAREDADQLQDKLSLWLQGYGLGYDNKFQIITEKYAHQYPDATKQLVRYERQFHSADKALIDMASLLFALLDTDLSRLSERQIEKALIMPFRQSASLVCCDMLSDFLVFGGYTQRRFVFTRNENCMETYAYPLNDYAVMVAHVVNDTVIREGGLVPKAVANKRHADLWLYVALHVYASWRSTDYIRMVAPLLPYTPEETLKRARNGSLHPKELRTVAEYFVAVNSLALNTPNKTQGTTGVPKLYFYCPQSCMESFGLILAIAAAHYQLDPQASTYVKPVKHWTVIKRFFGDEFIEACGRRSFSGRRANKSLMQCIEYAGREEDGLSPTVAYHLASIMRSHKLSYGKLSETTDIYLRDATFSGLTPERVAYHMWERGVCSFVTDTMLKICYGDRHARLSVTQQTAAITGTGLTPGQTAKALQLVQVAEDYACDVIKAVCHSKESIETALKKIACGYGTGKEQDVYCLCKAAGMECKHKDRLSCMGCRFEIRTKALLLRYAVMHQELMRTTEDMSELERARRKHLCKTVTYPAMKEILMHLDAQPETEYALYEQLIQEVMTYGIACDRTS